ncbi:putative chromate ion transporter [Aspergillus alliaceus]|uniref:putative chromate ion transporter n=1 Tax=Petromyces alliaceus TaxID=209559 RepID=UPI0012A565F5|nr:chromate transporter-domain-containing protein [Aspergillus alliaceus]KAB8230359.1 chromate transporter-domain-containing protein [Aspergillus alliaceus]
MLLPACFSRPISSLRSLHWRWRGFATRRDRNNNRLSSRLLDVFLRTWDLGFTSFGGPPVHFRILHERFVQGKGGKEKWVDEQTYQELFALCQGLPGPASTKMLFCLTLLHAGFIPALLAFLLWSMPGAIGMYSLAIGVQKIGDTLPSMVYALLSGLNSSTVGIIALAAVQLAEKAIYDKLTRILVIFGACAGLCYNALWYFPLLLVIGGAVTVLWNGWMSQRIRKMELAWKRRHSSQPATDTELSTIQSIPMEEGQTVALDNTTSSQNNLIRPRNVAPRTGSLPQTSADSPNNNIEPHHQETHTVPLLTGILLTIFVFAILTTLLLTKSLTLPPPLPLSLLTNMYLAGTIIFGGGPVVIPLLRTSVETWVQSRDFLLGLALIQAFPGPNFNFAIFLSTLAVQGSAYPSILGAVLGGVGIFFPGLALAVSVQSFWGVLRRRKWFVDFLRGVNATAVGLVFTAVYRLWEIGFLTEEMSSGGSLGKKPWWVVVATVSYAGGRWFELPAVGAIVCGGLLGLAWFGVVR